MTSFLLFTLYAPLSSWGSTAMGEVRGSWDRPGRSALLGLIAAAHGIDRADAAAHAELDASLRTAVRVAVPGREMIDYHTAQDPSGVSLRKFKPTTRKEALECAEPETTLSRRTLREDALYRVAVWLASPSRWSLDDHARALASPVFPLFAGRRANVLGLPLDPRVVEASTLAEALSEIPKMPAELMRLRPRAGWGREVSHDACEGFDTGLTGALRSALRRDAAPDRTRWHFAERRVYSGFLPEETAQ